MVIGLAFAGLVVFGGTLSVYAYCSNPSPLPSGYAAPCPVFSVSPSLVAQTGTLMLNAAPQAGTDYIYTTAYYAKGSTWLATTLTGNNAAPSYSSGPASGSLSASILASLPTGTNYVVLWDWLWDAQAQCYKGPGLNQCNTGTWRVQMFSLTSSTQGAAVSISPTSLTFPSTQVGAISSVQYATLTNVGSTALTISNETISGDFQFGGIGTCNLNVAINPNTNCTISVVFGPAQTGTRTGQINVIDNAPGSPQIINLTGTAASSSTYTYSQSAYTSGCMSGCNNYYVSTSGSDSNNGTSPSTPWRTCSHAVASFSLGSGGAIINFAPGDYGSGADCNVNRGGSSRTVRLVLKCSSQIVVGGTNNCRGISFFTAASDNIDIGALPMFGFEYTNPNKNYVVSNNNAPCEAPAVCPHGNSIHVLGNYFHDIGQNFRDPQSSQLIGCPLSSTVDSGPSVDLQVIGNIIDHFGTPGPNCQGAHGIYLSSPGAVVENNVITRAAAGGAQIYHTGCNETISNNVFANNGKAGLILYSTGACTPGLSTVDNNIIVNNVQYGVNSHYTTPQQYCVSGRPILFSNNIMFGNGTDFSNPIDTSCETRQAQKSENPTSTFVNYTGNASTGDYHLKAGSAAINGGTTQCVSGGISPCTPATDITGKTRPNPPSIGAYEQ